MDEISPSIIVLCETKLENSRNLRKTMDDFDIMEKCVKSGKGGLMIGVKKNFFSSFINVTSTPNERIIVGQATIGSTPLRIIACHAPQEDDLKDIRDEFFEDLSIEISKSKLLSENFIVAGDLNAKIIKSSYSKVTSKSSNGKLLQRLIEDNSLEVVNFSDKCHGRWTHVIRTSGKTSVIDYVLTSSLTEKFITKMLIDESCILCPFKVKCVKGKRVQQFSDHNAFVLDMNFPVKVSLNSSPCSKTWKINDIGLAHFNAITNECLHQHIEDYDEFEEYTRNKMNLCFQKSKGGKKPVTKRINNNYQCAIESLVQIYNQGKVQRNVARKYIDIILKINQDKLLDYHFRSFSERISQLTVGGKLSMESFWKLKNLHCKKGGNVLSSVVAENGVEVFGTSAIINEYKNEFVKRLSPVAIHPDFKEYENLCLELSRMCIETCSYKVSKDFTLPELESCLNDLKKGKAYPDEFPSEVFIHGGKEFKILLLKIFNLVKNRQEIPHKWLLFQITTIYKKKGSLKDLINQRGIFLTPVISKLFEKLIKLRISDELKKVSKWQAGSRCNRSSCDQTFLIRSAINHSLYLNKPLFLTLYDFRQCFDKIWLEDAIISLWKLGVQNDMLKLIYLLNAMSRGTVKTACGLSDRFDLGPNVKQGTVLGPVLASSSIAEACEEQSEGGAMVGTFPIRALAYVDDMTGLNSSIRDVHNSHDKVVFFSNKKRTPLNEDKCVVLPVNVDKKLASPVLYVNCKEMDIVDTGKVLGDIFNSNGNNQDLVKDRIQRGLRCLILSFSLASEITYGHYIIQVLITLYKVMFVTVVTFNSGAWNNLTKKDVNDLRTSQMKFLKRILHAPKSATNCFILLELGILPIESQIQLNQLNFLHHVLSLNHDDPVYCAYNQQKQFSGEKNWYNEVLLLREKLSLSTNDSEISKKSADSWRMLTKQKVISLALENLNKENSIKSKTNQFPPSDVLRIQEYFLFLSPSDARMYFAMRCGTLDIKVMRPYQYGDNTLCRVCNASDESLNHIINFCSEIAILPFISNIFSLDTENVKMVVQRLNLWFSKIENREEISG